MNPSCLTCNHLGECSVVNEEKVYGGYCCGDWRGVDNQATFIARDRIVRRFGLAGAAALVNRVGQAKEE